MQQTMEPFVQRMLERAKARRERLDTQLSSVGHDVVRRSPLKDANAILAQVTAATNVSPTKTSPFKSPSKTTIDKTPVKPPRKSPPVKCDTSENYEQVDKENGDFESCKVRSKLQRLGKLYSDDNCHELSSPIHRTEEKFNAEDDTEHNKPVRRGARLDKLAALASTINSWEDDLSHPKLTTKPLDNKVERIQAKFNEQVKSGLECQPSTSGYNKSANEKKGKNGSPVKNIKWDKNILECLESNTVSSNVSQNKEERKRVSPSKMDGPSKTGKTDDDTSVSESPGGSSFKSNSSKNTPEKIVKNANTTSSSRLPRFGFNGSPKDLVQASGSVLSKASMFEAKNTDAKAKDPVQMTIAERMALFERNKGEAPLIPKAPLTMSIPPKKLQEKDKLGVQPGPNVDSSPGNRNADIPGKSVSTQRAIFEQNKHKTDEMENQILQATQAERRRELDMLRSRFNENREFARNAVRCGIRTSESSEGGGKSSSPKSSPVCPVKPTPAPDHAAVPPPPLPPPLPQPQIISYITKSSPVKRQVVGSPPKVQHINVVPDVKRIRVAPPKPKSLYPNLENIELTTESDTESTYDTSEPATATLDEKSETDTATSDYEDQDEETAESERTNDPTNTSFGRSILHEFNERSLFNKTHKKRSIEPDPDSTMSDLSVLNEMDQYLEECLEAEDSDVNVREEGPTPPKVNRGKSPSRVSSSFNYHSFRSPLKVISPTDKTKPYIDEGGSRVPLMRTVSAYRRQQSELAKTPQRPAAKSERSGAPSGAERSQRVNEAMLVEKKVKELLDEVCTQQKKIEGASKALNLCQSTVEFNGSSEHVGGEWALLVATHKRLAALNEVQRLKREGTLRPVAAGSPEIQGSGSLTISAITLPLKPEFFRNMGNNAYLHCVCLMRHLGEVVATQTATAAEPDDSCLRFPSTLKFDELYSDFRIAVEVYSLQTQPKYLPHERKYHINHTGTKAVNKTPKKKSQFVMPSIQSPAGPGAVRSPAFQLCGTVSITLNDIHRKQFNLLGISSQSPLEGYLRMHMSHKISVSVEHRGFLTVFEDISGLGAWDRRWCLLRDAKLFFWLHPEDEHKKSPIGSLDLEGIFTKNVQFVNREKCARPFTFLLEAARPAQPGDANNLIMKTDGHETVLEHFMLADTREEGLQWLSKLNKTFSLIRAWGPYRS
ncbi:PREDICTED: actin-binding protein anillin-like isoform X2 [Dinoponera quadriceps]|uniref:Actin-binding protein anillin-like isoform X2 n=1 Tax=Dinoponera quadriceps TaxID=609295 RepID=A0A6P3Y671_DINQU|nr:PREDICTED: actin-binding protein anillin-like isoform X2 [Dinoponera quadriceps]